MHLIPRPLIFVTEGIEYLEPAAGSFTEAKTKSPGFGFVSSSV